MRRIVTSIVLLAAALGACGKSSSDVISPNAASIVALSGSGQADSVVATLHDSLVVKVSDQAGNPLAGATVSWIATQGGGSFNSNTSKTDASGRSAVTWVLGVTAGPQVATANVGSATPASFTATARPGAPTSLAYSGDAQAAPAGTVVAAPLLVLVKDKWGNAIPRVAVAWTVKTGGGSLSASSVVTDSTGRASVTWKLGAAGPQSATASKDSLSHTFTATAF